MTNTINMLVVEDEIPLQDAIRAKAEKSGLYVVTARSVEQAMGLLKDLGKVDVIWLDHYLLGKENGLDFVTKIKNNDKYKKIPVFVVSNTASADKVHSYIALGIEKYYTKADCRLDKIIDDIKSYLEKKWIK